MQTEVLDSNVNNQHVQGLSLKERKPFVQKKKKKVRTAKQNRSGKNNLSTHVLKKCFKPEGKRQKTEELCP